MIDEVFNVLSTITHTKNRSQSNIFILSDKPLKTHEVLQELRDISSMAIDHFEEKIVPSLKKAYNDLPSRSSLLNCSSLQYPRKYFIFVHHIFLLNQETKRKKQNLMSNNFITIIIFWLDSPDSLNISGLSLPAIYSQLQQSTSASISPQKQINVRSVDPYQSNYIRMERKFKTAMRKVK